MRIALLTDSDAFAGTERHMIDLAGGLIQLEVPAEIVCPGEGALAKAAREAGLPLASLEKRGLLDWSAVGFLKSSLKSGRYDVIHAHNGRTAFLAAVALMLAGRGALVFTQHFLSPAHVSSRGPVGWLRRRIHRWIESRTAAIIAISGPVKEAMLCRMGQDGQGSRVRVVPNGITSPKLASFSSREAFRESLGIPADATLIVSLARLEKEKDVGTLIRAMAEVSRALPLARCVIAGQGSQHGPLQTLINNLGLQDRVRLAGFRKDAHDILNAADLFVLPSPAEPFGLSVVEAMALGKPVAAVRAGGPIEIVVHGETGLLVSAGNPQELSAAMMKILSSPGLAQQMSLAGRERFEKYFTAQRMAHTTLEVYQGVLSADETVSCHPKSSSCQTIGSALQF